MCASIAVKNDSAGNARHTAGICEPGFMYNVSVSCNMYNHVYLTVYITNHDKTLMANKKYINT